MFCSVLSAAIAGVDALPVSVEADVSEGMPVFNMVGFVSAQVREAQERVRTALHNLHVSLPPQRVTINLAPGDLRKEGTRFDLPIAAAILEALGHIPPSALERTMILGELHLDGKVERITGVLPSVLVARASGCTTCIVPASNVTEARAVGGIRIIGIRTLTDLLLYGKGSLPEEPESGSLPVQQQYTVDFRDIHGQKSVKRAALIAAAGFHNLLLSGPPGSGKSMTAERIPTIMPELTREESLEISRIYSIMGVLPESCPLMTCRPFRAPHHTITPSALCGGGMNPRPGEITLAHRGVLFLDELPEISSGTLEMLRQPLESRQITISRSGGTYIFPASFLLVAAMNPCPCGYFPDRNKCSCSPREILAYQSRISLAILDRIDLRCDVPSVSFSDLSAGPDEISSEHMREQVQAAVDRQKYRYRDSGTLFNSEIRSSDMERFCPMTDQSRRLLEAAFDRFAMSARGYHRTIKVARTIADLDGSEEIKEAHISEALCFRCGERRMS